VEGLQSESSKEILAGTVFEKNFDAITKGKRFIVNQGGSRSGKTYSIIQLLIYLCQQAKVSVSVVSISFPHLRRGAIRDFLEIMEAWEIYDPNRHTTTDQTYKFPNGSYLEFFSVDQPGKVRGPGRDILFVNEANLISWEVFGQLNIRTKQTVFLDFNPADEFSWIYDKILPDKNCEFIQSTYKDNPFLPKDQRAQIEGLKDADPDLWRVYGLGERGVTRDTIYGKFELFEAFPDLDYHFGLDFGFTHPNALVRVCQDENKLYLEQCLYESGLTGVDLADRIAPIVGNKYVYCDSARPEIIEELRRAGISAYEADKSVKEGIDYVRSHRIFVHRESLDIQKEMRSYKWKRKPTGETIDEPVKAFDDLMDAARYGAMGFKGSYSGVYMSGF
jgi:phage terminase large subunit